jgi:LCP family protein required for cell wall assembly
VDDMTMIRDLGRDLEHEPPATLVRQRQRLLDTAAGVHRRRRVPGWTMLALVAGVTAVLVVVPTVLLRATPTAGTLGAPAWDRPPKQGQALNVLLVGSDSRPGPRGGSGGVPTVPAARTDTMVLLHLSADRKDVTAVSLPRDSMVRIPACPSSSGATTIQAHTGPINSAFSDGGLNCVWKTVESSTGVRVDHAVEIRFSGFRDMVDALGGVEITLPQAVNDRNSGLRLPAGRHLINGDQALAYVRTRQSLGDGSDLGRIKRQQQFMSALLKKASEQLADPSRLSAFLDVARKSITSDAGLDLRTMYAIAERVQRTGTRDVRFVTVPWRPSSADPQRLEWSQPAADRLFSQLRGD